MIWDDVVPKGASIKPGRFTVFIPEDELKEFYDLVRLSKLGPKTYENSLADQSFGVSYEWMENAKRYGEIKFDWLMFFKARHSVSRPLTSSKTSA
jgi:microsomal epoxide hydrolase